MNTGLVLIGMALLIFSAGLIVTPSGAFPVDNSLLVGAGDAGSGGNAMGLAIPDAIAGLTATVHNSCITSTTLTP